MIGVILAGGEGIRFSRGGCCKPLLQINGRSLIEHTLTHLASFGVNRALIVVGKYGPELRAALGDSRCGVSLEYVVQPQPLGLMNALYLAAGVTGDEDVALCLGDEFFISPEAAAPARLCGADFLCGYTVPEDPAQILENYALLCDESGTILHTVEKPAAPYNEKKGTGFCFFRGACMADLRGFYAEDQGVGSDLCDFFNRLIFVGRRGEAVRIAAREINVNNPQNLLIAERAARGDGI